MGIFDIFKKTNVERGKEAEDDFRTQSEIQGYKVKRKPIGSDFERSERDPFTGKIHKERWEVKRNSSPLSKRQKATRGLKVARYKDGILGPELRVEDRKGNELRRDVFTGRYQRVRKQDNDPFGINELLGGSEKPRRGRKRKDPFDIDLGF